MGLYGRYILPHVLDCACGLPAVERERARLVPQARGRVLEIGIGTGRNLPHYNPANVDTIVGLDPAAEMHPRARRRLSETRLSVSLMAVSAEQIPAEDDHFDTVLVTYSLCSIPDPSLALREMRRVLKPDGALLFCEHGRSPEPKVARWQQRLTPAWRHIAGGCHLDRNVPELLTDAGFSIDTLDSGYIQGPKPLTWHFRGLASKHPAK